MVALRRASIKLLRYPSRPTQVRDRRPKARLKVEQLEQRLNEAPWEPNQGLFTPAGSGKDNRQKRASNQRCRFPAMVVGQKLFLLRTGRVVSEVDRGRSRTCTCDTLPCFQITPPARWNSDCSLSVHDRGNNCLRMAKETGVFARGSLGFQILACRGTATTAFRHATGVDGALGGTTPKWIKLATAPPLPRCNVRLRNRQIVRAPHRNLDSWAAC